SGQHDISIGNQVGIQAVGALATLAYTAVLTWVILKVVDMVTGNRVSEDEETEGLDLTQHEERGYDL
ncbi:MAG: ammonia channel protein, partial [Gammaproteobacteria bacterium]|nr:ammonia channel protein [Gammaproteobacteria bacterium]